MQQELNKLVNEAQQSVAAADDLTKLDQVRVQYLGKKGSLTKQMQTLGKLAPEDRREAGMVINAAKQTVEESIGQRRDVLQKLELDARLASEAIDVSMPDFEEFYGRGLELGWTAAGMRWQLMKRWLSSLVAYKVFLFKSRVATLGGAAQVRRGEALFPPVGDLDPDWNDGIPARVKS